MNILPAMREGDELVVAEGWRIPYSGPGPRGEVKVGLRPEAIELVPQAGPDTAPARVLVSEPLGSEVIVNVMLGEHMIHVRTGPDVRPRPDDVVYLRAIPSGIRLFDAETGDYLKP